MIYNASAWHGACLRTRERPFGRLTPLREPNMQKQSQLESRSYLRAPTIGAAFAFLLVISPILLGGHAFLILLSLGGLVIVVGGVVAVAFMSFKSDDVHTALNAIVRMFKEPERQPESLRADMANIIKWSGFIAQKRMRDLEFSSGKN